jgi:hypothetical protein
MRLCLSFASASTICAPSVHSPGSIALRTTHPRKLAGMSLANLISTMLWSAQRVARQKCGLPAAEAGVGARRILGGCLRGGVGNRQLMQPSCVISLLNFDTAMRGGPAEWQPSGAY